MKFLMLIRLVQGARHTFAKKPFVLVRLVLLLTIMGGDFILVACQTEASEAAPVHLRMELTHRQVRDLNGLLSNELVKNTESLQGNKSAGALLFLKGAILEYFAQYGPSPAPPLIITVQSVTYDSRKLIRKFEAILR